MTVKTDLRTTDTKEKILKEARRLYQAGGYSYMGLDNIARSLNITRAALYHHFPDGKEQMLIEMVAAATNEKAAQWQTALESSPNARERLRLMLLSIIAEPLLDHRQLICAKAEELDEKSAIVIQESFRKLYDLAMLVFQEGIERGELRQVEPDVAFFSFIGLCKQVEDIMSFKDRLPNITACNAIPSEVLTQKLLELWLDGIALPQSQKDVF